MKLTSHMSAHAMCQWQLTQARRTDLMLARDARRTDVNIYIYSRPHYMIVVQSGHNS